MEFAAIFILGSTVAFVLAVVIWQRQPAAGTLPFSLLMLAIAWWEITSAFEMLAADAAAKVFWARLEYFGVAAVPYFWFQFAAEYSGATQWLTRRAKILLGLPALLTLLAVFTNEWHGLFWATITPGATPQANLTYEHGPLFWLTVIGNYGLMLAGTVLLARAVLRSHELYRRQVVMVLIGVFIPWGANIFYLTGALSLENADPTPLALTCAGALWVAALYNNRFFDLVPVARDVVVEKMSDGVIVLNAHNRIMDVNRAALELLGANGEMWIGQPAERVLGKLGAWSTVPDETVKGDVEIKGADGSPRYLSVRLSPLNAHHKQGGRLLLLQDITERKRSERALQDMNWQLQKQLEENKVLQATLHEQVIRDPLTGLYNRRFLHEILSKELSQSSRTLRPVSVMLLDIDHFKSFNDTYGHYAGDVMLKALADWLRTKTRRGDFVCRFGGEEFVVVMPGAPLEVGAQRAQEWCAGFRELHIWHDEMLLHTTLSLGVAASPAHGTTPDELLHSADMAMYAAKQAGRDCVRLAKSYADEIEIAEPLQPTVQ